jgi:hypothetical protein
VTVEQTAQRTSGYAVASLVLGIAGFFVFPVIPSILAIVFGNKAREEIRSNPAVAGDGLATAGIVLGWIGLAITGLVVVLGLLILLAIAGY